MDGRASEAATVEFLIDDLDERIDVEGVESEREERKLEQLRAFMRTIPAGTTIETMSGW